MASSEPTPVRQIGQDGPKIPAVGFGLMGFSIGYGAAEADEERFKLLDRAWELGCTNWDTADAYGDSEATIGKWLARHPERRAGLFLATKFGLRPDDGSSSSTSGLVVDSSPEYCRACIDASLARLGVDQIDLYYMHRADPSVPIEKTVGAMKELVNSGKVKYLGLSEVSAATLRRAHAVHPIAAVQVEYNPWTLDVEEEEEGAGGLLAACRELGVSVFAYSPLGRGIMTGRYRSAADFGPGDARAGLPRFQGDNFARNLALVDRFAEVARRKGCTPGQLVLAWLLAQGPDVFVIPGTKKRPYLEENFAAAHVDLSAEEERSLRALVEEAGVGGDRGAIFGSFIDTVPLDG
ncbi:putative alcohol dehydrogenase [Rosellinia necatrix]|uniref:Putative alcohol dehydrogenase n=1 Tax=Rosellinia necatrix TaxID=77044 RepID=A0A1W2TEF7_ROSNE|nr:putative alcohol dehydrogenase [Rosellinia necatrix]